MKINILTYGIIMLTFSVYAQNLENRFVIKDIQMYAVPTERDVLEAKDKMFGFARKLMFHHLVSPRKLKSIMVDIVCQDGEDKGAMRTIELHRNRTFTLPHGRYKLMRHGYHLIIEEMINDQNFIRMGAERCLSVPEESWQPRKERSIRIFCYPDINMVTIRGRIVNKKHEGVPNIVINCHPEIADTREATRYIDMETQTDQSGAFEFKDIPPASLDLAVRFLLFGRMMKASYNSERLFYSKLFFKDYAVNHTEMKHKLTIPLVTADNLKELRVFADGLRSLNETLDDNKLDFIDEKTALDKLPVSTNNVIYVGDIVLPGKKRQ